jgi:hypothetical protein
MTNPILTAFTLAAMVSKSAKELLIHLNTAHKSANEQLLKSAEDFIKRFDKAFGKNNRST